MEVAHREESDVIQYSFFKILNFYSPATLSPWMRWFFPHQYDPPGIFRHR